MRKEEEEEEQEKKAEANPKSSQDQYLWCLQAWRQLSVVMVCFNKNTLHSFLYCYILFITAQLKPDSAGVRSS
jgi:hypothetical protein